MKPLNEAEVRAALEDPHWPRRLCGNAEQEAEHEMGLAFLRHAAVERGEDPDAVLEAVRSETPLARTVRGLLGILSDLPHRNGRPSKAVDRISEYFVIERIRAQGLKGDEVFEAALAQLPGRRITVESLKRAYHRTKKQMVIPKDLKGVRVVCGVAKPD
ncbi:hypothetical protein ACFZ8E_23600 [Methylobacterium sp. HMF5984]|uniref:hypothetical protein n=1 Tax=Methylobacterium sp. HMF5984 TaxID=3367370 RepID=UPI003853E483